MRGLDSIDLKILTILMKDGRIKLKELAEMVGLTSPSVMERLGRLEREGIIKSYSTLVDAKKVGVDITAFIGVYIDHPSHIETFEEEIKAVGDEIMECHHVTGEWTLLLKIRTKNTETLQTLIKKIRSMKGVVRTNTMVVFSTLKETPAFKIE